MIEPDVLDIQQGDASLPALVWRWRQARWSIASGPHGGGIGLRHWVINAQVPSDYARQDPDDHLADLSASLGLSGPGVGMLTAAHVRGYCTAADGDVQVAITVGMGTPIQAAAPNDTDSHTRAGTINIVALLPPRLSDAALVNAVGTATEAKVQALGDAGFRATGTATDALCIACLSDGPTEDFGGPRSYWGSRLARAVHQAVLTGARAAAG